MARKFIDEKSFFYADAFGRHPDIYRRNKISEE